MSKRSVFTTITPLPAHISREAVINFLHDYEEMIDLNPLVKERHPIHPPIDADPDEEKCIWYSLTDKITYIPGGLATSDISYTCVFNSLPNGLQTHCRASMGVDIRDRWTVGGSLPGEPPEPVQDGVDTPKTGLYLREDCDLRCHLLMLAFVKKTLKKSHATLVDRLAAKALLTSSADRGRALSSQLSMHSASLQPGGHHYYSSQHQRSVSQPPYAGYMSGLGIAHPHGGDVVRPQQQQQQQQSQWRLSPQPNPQRGEYLAYTPAHYPERRMSPPLQSYRAEVVGVSNGDHSNPVPAPLRISRGAMRSVTPPFPSPAGSATSSRSVWRPSGQDIQYNTSVSSRQSTHSSSSLESQRSMTSSVTSAESYGPRYDHDTQPAKPVGNPGEYAAHPDYPMMNPYAEDPRSATSTPRSERQFPTFTELVGEPFPKGPKVDLSVSATLNGPWVDEMDPSMMMF